MCCQLAISYRYVKNLLDVRTERISSNRSLKRMNSIKDGAFFTATSYVIGQHM